MEQFLRKLFDYQKFSPNSRLDAMLSELDSRCSKAISDDMLDLVSAAGNGGMMIDAEMSTLPIIGGTEA